MNFFQIDKLKEKFNFYIKQKNEEPKISILRKTNFDEFLKIILNFEIISKILKTEKILVFFSKLIFNLYKKKIKMKISCILKFFNFLEKFYFQVNEIFLEDNFENKNIYFTKKLFFIIYIKFLDLLISTEEFISENKKKDFSYKNIIFTEEKILEKKKIEKNKNFFFLENLNFVINKKFFEIQKNFLENEKNFFLEKEKNFLDLKKNLKKMKEFIKNWDEKKILEILQKNLKNLDLKKYLKKKEEFSKIIENVKIDRFIIHENFQFEKILEIFNFSKNSKNLKNEKITLNQIKNAILGNLLIDKELNKKKIISFSKKFSDFIKNNKNGINLEYEKIFKFFRKNEKILEILENFLKGEIFGFDIFEKIKIWDLENFNKKKKLFQKLKKKKKMKIKE